MHSTHTILKLMSMQFQTAQIEKISKGENMKKTYEKSEIRITRFDNEEVLVASSMFDKDGNIELPFIPAE